ncbi:TPA: hypothetical protein CPT87_03020 [Candidatus Gastranaerophilales bacterium HUM_5]|nr:MAG TPA: hypothetical protein CPT99_07490 [Candidatus Gastranaerophilales bacterium HUM_4]DAA91953.1 MAG TPA: hypothetical protein CPT87_03020 [Candidatus Gastranaerophilales bacterium HUM_5]
MKDIKIDLVYLWVNDKDEKWQKKRKYWANKLEVNGTPEDSECRYSNNDELKYSLRSAEMYAPWINKIFIVTDNQIPDWLDTNHPKIRIIDHKEIMPEECLPCFNSNAIETCIDNITELSEYFLYANDDMFFSSPVKPDDFFDKTGRPIVNLRLRDWLEAANTHMQNIEFTINLFQTKFNLSENLKTSEPSHCIDAYRKSGFSECKKKFQKVFDRTMQYKFRSENAVQRIIHSFYMLEKQTGVLCLNPKIEEQDFQIQVDNLYLKLDPIDFMRSKIECLKPKLLCINDSQYTCNTDRKNLKQLLYQLFDKKAIWEKIGNFQINPIYKDGKYNTIVFSFNNSYCRYFSVILQSIISNSTDDKYYDIVVFNNDIDENNKKLLYAMLPERFSLRFFDMLDFLQSNFANLRLKTRNNWSVEMYYRIFIPLVMPDYKKVLYLDSDMVTNCNITQLFEINFDDKEILAVKDTTPQVFHMQRHKERQEYVNNLLKLKNEKNYFNSGMIMFNIAQIDKTNYIGRIKQAFQIEELLYPDQDILNVIFEDTAKLISSQWNFCCGDFVWDKHFINHLSGNYLEDIKQAIKEPKVIHFTSPRKPWNYKLEMHFELFWNYARKTPFYEEILQNMNKEATLKIIAESAKYTNLYLQIQNNKRIVFWGASLFLEEFVNRYDLINDNVIGIIDKNPSKKGKFIRNYEIFAPEDIVNLSPDEIIITIVNSAKERAEEINNYLKTKDYNNITVKTL